MIILDEKEQKIMSIFLQRGEMQSSDVYREMTASGEDTSLVTVKRTLSELAKKGAIVMKGSGRSTRYVPAVLGRVFASVDAEEYISVEPDKRYGLHGYNPDLFKEFPTEIFTEKELAVLCAATDEYKKRVEDISDTIQKKELERLTVELSWKSSRIEGNTYTLLDTENLLLKNKPAADKTKEETRMILNHKDAFTFAHENKEFFTRLTKENLEKLHDLVIKDLRVGRGLRKHPVGVSGSLYRPLDNVYQISEAVEGLCAAVNKMKMPHTKATATLLGISYIQPFEDGNKRTSRIMADAMLMAHGCPPLSYRSVDEEEYRAATLVFYELNSVMPFKKIFIEQYDFAAKNYAVK